MERMTLELVDETPSAPNGQPAAGNVRPPSSRAATAAYTRFVPPAPVTSLVTRNPALLAAAAYQQQRQQQQAQEPPRINRFAQEFVVDDDWEDPEDTVRPLTETYFEMFCAMVAKAVDTLCGMEWTAPSYVVNHADDPPARMRRR